MGPSDEETAAFIREFLAAATSPVRAGQADEFGILQQRFKGLKCLEKIPLYKELVEAIAERNACEHLYSKTEQELKALDRKVQKKFNNILEAKEKRKKGGLSGVGRSARR